LPGEVSVIDATARLGGELFSVRISLPAGLPAPPPVFDAGTLLSLGAMPLSLPLVAAVALASPEELLALSPGAAWLPGEAWAIAPSDRGWQGRGWLVAGGGELGAEVSLEMQQNSLALVLRHPCGSRSWEPPMSTPLPDASAPALADVLAETPVVVRVEVASITLEAQQWARLGVGDVVASGVRLGEPVVLRAGGSVFARGELCVLDGELAVKILQRF